jgi:DNA-binding NarL/FixJ family response regulator
MAKVLIVDDHALLRRGVREIVEAHPGWEVCGELPSGEAAVRAAAALEPNVIIMDVSMPGMGGLKATKMIHEALPQVKVVLLTLHNSSELLRAGLSAGATGYVLKSDGEEELIHALEAACRNEFYVTPTMGGATVADILRDRALRGRSAGTTANPNS